MCVCPCYWLHWRQQDVWRCFADGPICPSAIDRLSWCGATTPELMLWEWNTIANYCFRNVTSWLYSLTQDSCTGHEFKAGLEKFTKQYKLVPAIGWEGSTGRASLTLWYNHLRAQWPGKGRWAPGLSSIWSTTASLPFIFLEKSLNFKWLKKYLKCFGN